MTDLAMCLSVLESGLTPSSMYLDERASSRVLYERARNAARRRRARHTTVAVLARAQAQREDENRLWLHERWLAVTAGKESNAVMAAVQRWGVSACVAASRMEWHT